MPQSNKIKNVIKIENSVKNNSQNIKSLLKTYQKDFDKVIQRAELLKRNPLFHQELNGFRNRVGDTFFKVFNLEDSLLDKNDPDNILLKLDYPVADYTDIRPSPPLKEGDIKLDRYWKGLINLDAPIYAKPNNFKEELSNKTEILRHYIRKWDEFCSRWHIESEWNGDLTTFEQYIRQNVEIYQDWDYNTQQEGILIRITEWATIEDIKTKWNIIQSLQDEVWGKKESRTNFGRDLIWYDLAKTHKTKPSEIAEIWAKNYPDDVDLIILRRFSKEIDKADLRGRFLDDKELLKEIKDGFLSKTYLQHFLDEWEYYLTGKIKKGTKYVTIAKPFVDVIKKAIKRMEQQITSVSMPPLPEDRSFIGSMPQRVA